MEFTLTLGPTLTWDPTLGLWQHGARCTQRHPSLRLCKVSRKSVDAHESFALCHPLIHFPSFRTFPRLPRTNCRSLFTPHRLLCRHPLTLAPPCGRCRAGVRSPTVDTCFRDFRVLSRVSCSKPFLPSAFHPLIRSPSVDTSCLLLALFIPHPSSLILPSSVRCSSVVVLHPLPSHPPNRNGRRCGRARHSHRPAVGQTGWHWTTPFTDHP